MLSAGSVFAGYRVERVLGAGGMGTVYLVRDPDLPRSDALKILSAELSRDPDFRARFVREADVAARLDHPNIVLVYRRGDFDGQLWIAMQYIDGSDADDALRAGTMTPARAVHIVGQVGKALDYAHAHGVVHRDVKPANFLLSGPVGPDERVMLSDFGIARVLGDAGLTVTGSLVATLSYAAPEVLAGVPFDGRADLYSLGCTLFRMLTGQTPFSGENGPGAVVAAHLQAPPPRVTDRVPGLSARMDQVIATAMAKDPARRFSSARELAAAAAEALHDAAVNTTAPWQPIPSAQVSSYPAPTLLSGQHRVDGPSTAIGPGYFAAPFPPLARRRRGRIVAAALTVVAVAAAAAFTAVTLYARSHRPSPGVGPTTAAAPPLPAAALTRLLLPADQIAAIMATPKVTVEHTDDTPLTETGDFVGKDCVGAWQPAQGVVYNSVGQTGVRAQTLGEAIIMVIQAVIAMPSADAAHKLVTDQTPVWSACAGRTFVDNRNPAEPTHWTFGQLTNSGGTLSMTHAPEEHPLVGCQRALSARSNIVIDVLACKIQADNQAVDILNAIAANVTH
jgi:eukaryotic-like serine/threonine-protein kinase